MTHLASKKDMESRVSNLESLFADFQKEFKESRIEFTESRNEFRVTLDLILQHLHSLSLQGVDQPVNLLTLHTLI